MSRMYSPSPPPTDGSFRNKKQRVHATEWADRVKADAGNPQLVEQPHYFIRLCEILENAAAVVHSNNTIALFAFPNQVLIHIGLCLDGKQLSTLAAVALRKRLWELLWRRRRRRTLVDTSLKRDKVPEILRAKKRFARSEVGMKRPRRTTNKGLLVGLIWWLFWTVTTATASSHEDADCPKHSLKLVYLVMVHDERTAQESLQLIPTLQTSSTQILVHVDKKQAHWVEYLKTQLQDRTHCGKLQIDSVHSVEWSRYSMNLPTLWGMETALQEDFDVFVNLSGDALAVYTAQTISDTLQNLPYNFVTSSSCETGLWPTPIDYFPKWWHKHKHYTKAHTITFKVYFGSQWVILQRDFCEFVMDQMKSTTSWVSQFRDYLISNEFLMTDETFLPTVLMMHDDQFPLPKVDNKTGRLLFPNGTSTNILDARFERMDEHYMDSRGNFPMLQRYEVPPSVRDRVGDPHAWGPYFLGVYDLHAIRHSGALFVRKVSRDVDANLRRLLPVSTQGDIPDIHWPDEVSVIGKPDWSVEQETWNEIVQKEQQMRQQDTQGQAEVDADEEL